MAGYRLAENSAAAILHTYYAIPRNQLRASVAYKTDPL
jgi:hypothetical protein